MAATTTPSIRSLIKKLEQDYPHIGFRQFSTNAWNPNEETVYFEPTTSCPQILHELGHALLEHQQYHRDIELVTMERDAWQKALELAPDYTVTITPDDIDSHLDTYREWLHTRSVCPICGSNGIQNGQRSYRCIDCRESWRVNDARTCGLKRYRN